MTLTRLEDRRLIDQADFILAVRANLPPQTLRQMFVQKAKVVSLEALSETVPLQLPGIPLVPLPVAPQTRTGIIAPHITSKQRKQILLL
ncbi:hypothetical protein D3C80_640710 [compost metagenome]